MNIPAHPFCEFSAAIYREPGVADACLYLQDRYGLNVNLVLFCVWVASTGGGVLTAEIFKNARRRIADWEQQVVEPLREIRRACRHDVLGVPEFLLKTMLPNIEGVELEAEFVEQLLLAELPQGPASAAGSISGDELADPAGNAVRSLSNYVEVLGVVPDVQLTECLSVILRTAFTGACFPVSADG